MRSGEGHAQSIVGRGTKGARAATDYDDDDDEDVVVTMDARSKEENLNGERRIMGRRERNIPNSHLSCGNNPAK